MGKRLKIVGDGSRGGTRVEVDGEPIAGVQSVDLHVDIAGRAVATLVVKRPEFDMDGDFELERQDVSAQTLDHWAARPTQGERDVGAE